MANMKCKECGCACSTCSNDQDVHLHVEIENLKQRLVEKDNHIVTMETNFLNEANKFPNGELYALKEELLTWQDKYKRLYEAHRRVQRVNQGLEDKLLKLVDVCETEKNALTKDVASLSHKLADANYTIKRLTDDNERYKSDVALAIQFLQCKQSNFVSQKIDSLPQEVQAHVSSYLSSKRKTEDRKTVPDVKSIKVPIPTFPPTAMVYSIPKSPSSCSKVENYENNDENAPTDIVSAAIMAKVLEERQRERSLVKHCDTCTCSSKNIRIVTSDTFHHVGTQTTGLCFCEVNRSTVCGLKLRSEEKSEGERNNSLIELHDKPYLMSKNVVEVQPNNFLNNSPPTDSNNSSLINLSSASTSNLNLLDLSPMHSTPAKQLLLKSKAQDTVQHHRLCDKSSPSFEVGIEKSDVEINVDKTSAKDTNHSSENLNGPRYCSMRLQSGSRNILLDNAHNNIAPVLYTRQTNKVKRENTIRPHEVSISSTCSSEDYRVGSVSSENSLKNQQRIAEWVQNSNDFDVSSPENSKTESLRVKHKSDGLDLIKYAEMEDNVKKFLFGERQFLKTVELGKLKYQNVVEPEQNITDNTQSCDESRSNSHTETEI